MFRPRATISRPVVLVSMGGTILAPVSSVAARKGGTPSPAQRMQRAGCSTSGGGLMVQGRRPGPALSGGCCARHGSPTLCNLLILGIPALGQHFCREWGVGRMTRRLVNQEMACQARAGGCGSSTRPAEHECSVTRWSSATLEASRCSCGQLQHPVLSQCSPDGTPPPWPRAFSASCRASRARQHALPKARMVWPWPAG